MQDGMAAVRRCLKDGANKSRKPPDRPSRWGVRCRTDDNPVSSHLVKWVSMLQQTHAISQYDSHSIWKQAPT